MESAQHQLRVGDRVQVMAEDPTGNPRTPRLRARQGRGGRRAARRDRQPARPPRPLPAALQHRVRGAGRVRGSQHRQALGGPARGLAAAGLSSAAPTTASPRACLGRGPAGHNAHARHALQHRSGSGVAAEARWRGARRGRYSILGAHQRRRQRLADGVLGRGGPPAGERLVERPRAERRARGGQRPDVRRLLGRGERRPDRRPQ